MAQASEREEKKAVHEDVTESPGASTTIFIKVAPGPIQAPGLEVPCGARIREVPQQTAGVPCPIQAPGLKVPCGARIREVPQQTIFGEPCF